jgi:hypothetical protein
MRVTTRAIGASSIAVLLAAAWAQQPAAPSSAAAPKATTPAPAAQTVARIFPPPNGHRFPNGVTYVYKAEWKLWDAGEATLRLDRDTNGMQRVTATARSTGFVGKLFRVADQFEAVFNPQTFCSAYINKRTEEGRRRRNVQIRFDYQRQKSVVEDTNLRSGEKKTLENDIPACVTDVVSGLIYGGVLPLEPGQTHVFPLNDGKTVNMTALVQAREQIKTDAGTFDTVRVQPQASLGPLKGKDKAWIWYSDDGERIPVQMRGKMFWGTLTLKLIRIERPPPASATVAK